jgi:sRNA-binding protein
MSHEGIDKLADLFPHCFFRRSHLRRPLKLGIHEDIVAQHPELDRTLIGRGLNAYTHSTTYWHDGLVVCSGGAGTGSCHGRSPTG